MKLQRGNGPDAIKLKQKKNVWKRFIKIFPKCNLPYVWVLIYIAVEVLFANVGVSETDYTARLFSGDTSTQTVTMLIAIMIFNMVLGAVNIYVGHITEARINRNMRTVLFNKVMRLPLSFFKDEEPQEAIFRISDNAVMVDSTLMLVIIPIAMAAYKSVLIFSKVFGYDWRLSLILLVFIPLQIFMAFLFGRINYSVSERDSGLHAMLIEKLSEMIRNIPMAKAFGMENRETEKGSKVVDRLYRINIKSGWFDQIKTFSESALTLVQSLIITLVGVALLNGGALPTRSWVSFFLFSSTFNTAIEEILMYWNNLKIIQGGAERLCDIMDAEEEDLSGEPCENLEGDIEVKDVDFAYEEGANVFENVSCSFRGRGVTALLGESGCGKTTLVNLLMRLYAPTSGEIKAGGRNIGEYALEDYRRQFVMVPQNPMLFSGTVRENIVYGNEKVTDEQIEEVLAQVNAKDFVDRMPGGLDAELTEYAGNLSGGQKKRIALARALLAHTPYLIFDEPTSSLDAVASAEFMDMMKKIGQEKGVIVIAHTPAVLAIADRVVVLENRTAVSCESVSEAQKASSFVRGLLGEGAKA